MARQDFIGGGFIGKLGAVVGQRWKNKYSVRTWVQGHNPNTPAQLAHRAKFTHAMHLAQQALNINGRDPSWDDRQTTEFSLRVKTAYARIMRGEPDSTALPLFPDGTIITQSFTPVWASRPTSYGSPLWIFVQETIPDGIEWNPAYQLSADGSQWINEQAVMEYASGNAFRIEEATAVMGGKTSMARMAILNKRTTPADPVYVVFQFEMTDDVEYPPQTAIVSQDRITADIYEDEVTIAIDQPDTPGTTPSQGEFYFEFVKADNSSYIRSPITTVTTNPYTTTFYAPSGWSILDDYLMLHFYKRVSDNRNTPYEASGLVDIFE